MPYTRQQIKDYTNQLHDKGATIGDINAFVSLAAKDMVPDAAPNPLISAGKAVIGDAESVAGGINWAYQNVYKNIPGLKQAAQGVGDVVGAAGGVIGGAVGAVGQPIVNTIEKKPLFQGEGQAIVKSATDTAKFGYNIGKEGAYAAPLGAAGRVVGLALSASQAISGGQELAQGIANKDAPQAVEGGLQVAMGAVGAKGAIDSAGILTSPRGAADIEAGKQAIIDKTPPNTKLRGFTETILKPIASLTDKFPFLKEMAHPKNSGFDRLMTSAIRPTDTAGFKAALKTAADDLAPHAEAISTAPNSIIGLDTAVKAGKVSLWDEITKNVKAGDQAKLQVQGQPLVDSIMNPIINNTKMWVEAGADVNAAVKTMRKQGMSGTDIISNLMNDPKLANNIPALAKMAYQKAQAYSNGLSPVEAESIIEQLNAEEQTYYAKTNTKKTMAEKADPALASDLSLARTLRTGLDDVLTTVGKGVKGLKERYGALVKIGKEVSKKVGKEDSLNIMSLQEQMHTGMSAARIVGGLLTGNVGEAIGGGAEAIASKALRHIDTPSVKVKRAFGKPFKEFQSPKPVAPLKGQTTPIIPMTQKENQNP